MKVVKLFFWSFLISLFSLSARTLTLYYEHATIIISVTVIVDHLENYYDGR